MIPGPVVLKFGGTSVGDAEAIGRLVRHVSAAHERASAVVVVSALSGVTDRLFNLAAAAAATATTIASSVPFIRRMLTYSHVPQHPTAQQLRASGDR